MYVSISVCVEHYFFAGCPHSSIWCEDFLVVVIIIILLYTCLRVSVFKMAGVEDWRNKIVYLCADGASVNLGKDNGVAAKLRREVDYLITCHCVAHRLELGITKAIRDEPRFSALASDPCSPSVRRVVVQEDGCINHGRRVNKLYKDG